MNSITNTLHQSFRLTKKDRIIQWSLNRKEDFIRSLFRENWLRMSFVIVIYSSVAFIVGGPVNEQVRQILGFALGFPLMLFAIYAVIWLIRDREWREAVK